MTMTSPSDEPAQAAGSSMARDASLAAGNGPSGGSGSGNGQRPEGPRPEGFVEPGGSARAHELVGGAMRKRPTLESFLTDGALIGLCDALSELIGQPVAVYAGSGCRMVRTHGPTVWHALPPDRLTPHLLEHWNAGNIDHLSLPEGELAIPLLLEGQPAGALVVFPNSTERVAHTIDPSLVEALERLASVIDEFCEREITLRDAADELRVLYRLSSALTANQTEREVCVSALSIAAQFVDGVTLGMVHLLDDRASALRLAGSVGVGSHETTGLVNLLFDPPPQGTMPAKTRTAEEIIALGAARFERLLHDSHAHSWITLPIGEEDRCLGVMRLGLDERGELHPSERSVLQLVAEQTTASIRRIRLADADRSHRRQVRLAAQVQHRMFPRQIPEYPGLDVSARYLASLEVGGDFYDLFDLNGHMGIVVADVVGKGVPAGLMMASARASLRAHAVGNYHLNDIISRVNRDVVRDTLGHEFITIFYGVLDPVTLTLTYCNAGHEPPLIIRRDPSSPDGYSFTRLDIGGMAAGIDADQTYERAIARLQPGDVLLAMTDGLIEAMNFQMQTFGRDRLREAITTFLNDHPDASAKALTDHCIWAMRRFIGFSRETDDTTVLVIRAVP
jgi:sigma-B regulation protein RsbU (phosphoserine phosphatase)